MNLTVNALVRYVGGTVNFGFPSFSELELFWETNENLSRRSISPAFSGPVVLDKILSLALLAAGGIAPQKAQEIVSLIGIVYNFRELNNALHQLETAGNLKVER